MLRFLIGYMILAFAVFTLFWPMLKVASDSDRQTEEMLRERKADNEAKLNK